MRTRDRDAWNWRHASDPLYPPGDIAGAEKRVPELRAHEALEVAENTLLQARTKVDDAVEKAPASEPLDSAVAAMEEAEVALKGVVDPCAVLEPRRRSSWDPMPSPDAERAPLLKRRDEARAKMSRLRYEVRMTTLAVKAEIGVQQLCERELCAAREKIDKRLQAARAAFEAAVEAAAKADAAATPEKLRRDGSFVEAQEAIDHADSKKFGFGWSPAQEAEVLRLDEARAELTRLNGKVAEAEEAAALGLTVEKLAASKQWDPEHLPKGHRYIGPRDERGRPHGKTQGQLNRREMVFWTGEWRGGEAYDGSGLLPLSLSNDLTRKLLQNVPAQPVWVRGVWVGGELHKIEELLDGTHPRFTGPPTHISPHSSSHARSMCRWLHCSSRPRPEEQARRLHRPQEPAEQRREFRRGGVQEAEHVGIDEAGTRYSIEGVERLFAGADRRGEGEGARW